MKILDCTLRDGGYYTDWHFDMDLVRRYLACMTAVDMVEIGFRHPIGRVQRGPFHYCSPALIEDLDLKVPSAVMIDYKQFSDHLLYDLPVDMVRLAAHVDVLPKVRGALQAIKDSGKQCSLNVIRADTATAADFINLEHLPIDVLYFADSYGSMDQTDVHLICRDLRYLGYTLGFHGHDNKGDALENTMSAALHVLWLDSTVMGMGRGAGNTATEMLLLQMDRDYESLRPILPDFADLKAKYRWGPSLDYYLAAINGIHPMEVQCK